MITEIMPIWIVDVGGSVLMIVISFVCVQYAVRLKRRDPQNIVWAYLLWFSLSMAVFAISRSVGHILKQVFLLAENRTAWDGLRPYSGAINTLTFMVVASVTLFFERTWTIYEGIVRDRKALQKAHQEVTSLNQSLEQRVAQRTRDLAHSEMKYRRIFEASKDIILTIDRNGMVIDINPAGRQLLDLPGVGLMDDIFLGNFFIKANQWEMARNRIATDGYVTSMEVDFKTSAKERFRVLISASQADDNEGTILYVIKDIEQQHLIREQMAKADKLASIGELSAGIAHEINNPLGVILGYTQLLLRQEKENEQLREDLKTVEKHVRHCKSIVEDLLNFARTPAPKKKLVSIHQILHEVVGFIRQHGQYNHIRFQQNYDTQIGRLMLDQEKIKQVFINLIMNAIHAIEAEGVIDIATGQDAAGENALIRVSDTGTGIERKNLVRIFDPFFTTKPTGKGTGLGLSVSYGIIRTHGGDIMVESTPGKGSTFIVILPLAAEPERS